MINAWNISQCFLSSLLRPGHLDSHSLSCVLIRGRRSCILIWSRVSVIRGWSCQRFSMRWNRTDPGGFCLLLLCHSDTVPQQPAAVRESFYRLLTVSNFLSDGRNPWVKCETCAAICLLFVPHCGIQLTTDFILLPAFLLFPQFHF